MWSKPIENREVYRVLEFKGKLGIAKCCIFVLRVYPLPTRVRYFHCVVGRFAHEYAEFDLPSLLRDLLGGRPGGIVPRRD